MSINDSETDFKTKVLKDLRSLPYLWCFKTQERTLIGIPDILFCCKGLFGAIELKLDEELPTLIQEQRLKGIRDAGGFAVYTTPKIWPETLKLIKELVKKLPPSE